MAAGSQGRGGDPSVSPCASKGSVVFFIQQTWPMERACKAGNWPYAGPEGQVMLKLSPTVGALGWGLICLQNLSVDSNLTQARLPVSQGTEVLMSALLQGRGEWVPGEPVYSSALGHLLGVPTFHLQPITTEPRSAKSS